MEFRRRDALVFAAPLELEESTAGRQKESLSKLFFVDSADGELSRQVELVDGSYGFENHGATVEYGDPELPFAELDGADLGRTDGEIAAIFGVDVGRTGVERLTTGSRVVALRTRAAIQASEYQIQMKRSRPRLTAKAPE